MTLRRTAVAATTSALLLTGVVMPAGASQVSVNDATCTVAASTGEYEDFVSAVGVFAANWAAEIVRDLPAVGADMSTARAWYADKTSEDVTDLPESVRGAEERIDAAGVRAGYREGEALAPLQLLLQRNDRRLDGTIGWFDSHRMPVSEAQSRLSNARLGNGPAILTSTRQDLSVPADEAWNRAWEATPQIRNEHDATLAELQLCSDATPGTVDRTTGHVHPDPDPAPGATGGLVGIIAGLHSLLVQLIAGQVPGLSALLPR